jgi:acyl-CoA synthetase (NDP forming)
MLKAAPARLSRLLRPRSIAFVGGSQVAGAIRACRRGGYAGKMWVVNPNATQIEGIACVPYVEDLPAAPDASVIGLSAERSIEAVKALAGAGAGGAVVMVAGFAEMKGDGVARQEALIAAAGDMPVIGPNCMGVLNQFDAAAVWGDDNHIERPEGKGAAIVSQSGALLIGMTNVEQVFPLGYAISTGNQAVTGMADCIEGVLEDDRVNAIGLYIEGMDDGQAMGRACMAALAKGVPVVALKGGDQAAGAEVAVSHTASMVVERDMWEAFCARFGVVEVSSPKALVETLKLLSIGGLPKANRLSIVSYSGGINGLAATRAGPLGLELPDPTPANTARLRDVLPETVVVANPIDLNIPYRAKTGISMQDTTGVTDAIVAFAEGVSDQIVFFIDVPRGDAAGLDRVWCDSLEALIEVREKLRLPVSVAGILPEGLEAEFRRHMARNRIAPLLGFTETMEALAVSAKLAAAHAGIATRPDVGSLFKAGELNAGQMLDEAASKAALAAHGLVIPDHRAVPLDQAADAGDEIGYPVALKVLSDTIAHKARLGGVHLNLADAAAVRAAAEHMATHVAAADGGHPVDRVLVEKMVADVHGEIIIGIKRHPALGLALMIGLGGSAAEQMARFETLLLPLQHADLDTATAKLGWGGHAGLRQAAQAVADYAAANHERLVTLDVNPVMLTADGSAIATDALIVLADEE